MELDPYPYRIVVIDRTDSELIALRDGERISDPAWATFWDGLREYCVFDPRAGYSQNISDYTY